MTTKFLLETLACAVSGVVAVGILWTILTCVLDDDDEPGSEE